MATGRRLRRWLRIVPRQEGQIWLLIMAILVALILDIFLPVPTSASETTKALRSQSWPLLATGLFGLIVYALQSGRARRERLRESVAEACAMMITAIVDFVTEATRGFSQIDPPRLDLKARQVESAGARLHLFASAPLVALTERVVSRCRQVVWPPDGDTRNVDERLRSLLDEWARFLTAAREEMTLG